MRKDKRPTYGYVETSDIETRKPHVCDTCGLPTTNIVELLDHKGKVRGIEEGLCDSCLHEFYPHTF